MSKKKHDVLIDTNKCIIPPMIYDLSPKENIKNIRDNIFPWFGEQLISINNIPGLGLNLTIKFEDLIIQGCITSKKFRNRLQLILRNKNKGRGIPNFLFDELIEHIEIYSSAMHEEKYYMRSYFDYVTGTLMYKISESKGVFSCSMNSTVFASNNVQGSVLSSNNEKEAPIELDAPKRLNDIHKIIPWIIETMRPENEEDAYLILGYIVLALNGSFKMPAL